jgi:hypothetical protein
MRVVFPTFRKYLPAPFLRYKWASILNMETVSTSQTSATLLASTRRRNLRAELISILNYSESLKSVCSNDRRKVGFMCDCCLFRDCLLGRTCLCGTSARGRCARLSLVRCSPRGSSLLYAALRNAVVQSTQWTSLAGGTVAYALQIAWLCAFIHWFHFCNNVNVFSSYLGC